MKANRTVRGDVATGVGGEEEVDADEDGEGLEAVVCVLRREGEKWREREREEKGSAPTSTGEAGRTYTMPRAPASILLRRQYRNRTR